MKEGEKYKNEITWPDSCKILVNGEEAMSILPLQNNSSLKKRRDKSFLFSKEMEEMSFKDKINISIVYN